MSTQIEIVAIISVNRKNTDTHSKDPWKNMIKKKK